MVVDLFVEDRAHEELLNPLCARVAREEHVDVSLRVRSARGGHGRAIREFERYQDLVEKGVVGGVPPDLLIVAIDGNCSPFPRARKAIEDVTSALFSDRLVVASPDPHVERWYLADPASFETIVGHRPRIGKKKCAHDHYKRLLAMEIQQAGHPATLGGIEFARELVAGMDLYRAGKTDPSLKAFLDDLRSKLRRLKRGSSGVVR